MMLSRSCPNVFTSSATTVCGRGTRRASGSAPSATVRSVPTTTTGCTSRRKPVLKVRSIAATVYSLSWHSFFPSPVPLLLGNRPPPNSTTTVMRRRSSAMPGFLQASTVGCANDKYLCRSSHSTLQSCKLIFTLKIWRRENDRRTVVPQYCTVILSANDRNQILLNLLLLLLVVGESACPRGRGGSGR